MIDLPILVDSEKRFERKNLKGGIFFFLLRQANILHDLYVKEKELKNILNLWGKSTLNSSLWRTTFSCTEKLTFLLPKHPFHIFIVLCAFYYCFVFLILIMILNNYYTSTTPYFFMTSIYRSSLYDMSVTRGNKTFFTCSFFIYLIFLSNQRYPTANSIKIFLMRRITDVVNTSFLVYLSPLSCNTYVI